MPPLTLRLVGERRAAEADGEEKAKREAAEEAAAPSVRDGDSSMDDEEDAGPAEAGSGAEKEAAAAMTGDNSE